jgi:hypothetical protein
MDIPFARQLEIAAAGNFAKIAVSPIIYKKMVRISGYSPEDIVCLAGEKGIAISHLDGTTSWASKWFPPQTDRTFPLVYDRFNFSSEECLDIAAALGMKSVVAVGGVRTRRGRKR